MPLVLDQHHRAGHPIMQDPLAEDQAALERSRARLLELEPSLIVPGHGAPVPAQSSTPELIPTALRYRSWEAARRRFSQGPWRASARSGSLRGGERVRRRHERGGVLDGGVPTSKRAKPATAAPSVVATWSFRPGHPLP